jgi:hypothetical protein
MNGSLLNRQPSHFARFRIAWYSIFKTISTSVHLIICLSDLVGPVFLRTTRPDLEKKYTSVFSDDTIPNYLYHCNAQTPRYCLFLLYFVPLNQSSNAP